MSGRARRVEYVLVYDGADQALMDAAQAEVDLAIQQDREDAARWGDDDTSLEDAIAKRNKVETEVAERADRLYLGLLDRHHWRWLRAKFPPREGNKYDEFQGWNDDHFPDALVASCLVDGPEADWLQQDEWETALRAGLDRLDEWRLAENELTEAFQKALRMCAGVVDPKERRRRSSPN